MSKQANLRSLLGVLLFGLLASSCATITRGRNDVLVVESDPLGATVTTSLGLTGKTPATFTVNRRGGFVVKIEREGYETVEVQVSSKIHGAGGTAMAGNILLGGLIGAAVDAGTGAMYDVVPNPIKVKLVPLKADGKATGAAPTQDVPGSGAVAREFRSPDEADAAKSIALRIENRIPSDSLVLDLYVQNLNSFAVSGLVFECQSGSTSLQSAKLNVVVGPNAVRKLTNVGFIGGPFPEGSPVCRVKELTRLQVER